jgi:transcriptional regulator with GAF, ATPase, and Fis domain
VKPQNQLKDQLEDLFSDFTAPEPAVELDAAHEDVEATPTQIQGLEAVEKQHDEPLQRVQLEPAQIQRAGDRARQQALLQQVASLEQANSQLQKRATRLEASTAVNRAVASILDPQELLQTTVNLIHDQFHLYHVSVFLLDDTGDWAILHTSTGDAGQELIAHPHRLAVGSESMVGWVCAHRQPRIALDVSADPIHLENPLLPKTRSEIVLPLNVNDTLLGALDVQSAKESAFDVDDVRTLQDIADVVALALQNAYRLAETRRTAQQQQLVARVTDRLQQVTSETEILILTLEGLGETFDLAQATICLGTEAELWDAGNGHEPEASAETAQFKE